MLEHHIREYQTYSEPTTVLSVHINVEQPHILELGVEKMGLRHVAIMSHPKLAHYFRTLSAAMGPGQPAHHDNPSPHKTIKLVVHDPQADCDMLQSLDPAFFGQIHTKQ